MTKIAVFYLARGADDRAHAKFAAFRDSYNRWTAGIEHNLIIIFKGFSGVAELEAAQVIFRGLQHTSIYLDDVGFDLSAYFAAASRVTSELVFFMNTSSVICGGGWLRKLVANHALPGVGLVGCSGSYEAPIQPGMGEISFPNPHLRSNAFLMRRDHFLGLRPNRLLLDKHEAHLFEHGPNGMTRRIQALGLRTLIVGRNGRGYEPAWWIRSDTFRQGAQTNLLVRDNQVQRYEDASIAEKRMLFRLAWGDGTIGIVSVYPVDTSNMRDNDPSVSN